MKLFKRKPAQQTRNLYAINPEFSQSICVESAAIKHIDKYRQLSQYDNEAGGQLFGRISPEMVSIIKASGPYKNDERGRIHYRSNPASAQQCIIENMEIGLIYLGEWHTHAEKTPTASPRDMRAMEKLIKKSELNINGLLMLIAGQSQEIDGNTIYSFYNGCQQHWQLEWRP